VGSGKYGSGVTGVMGSAGSGGVTGAGIGVPGGGGT